MKHPFVLTTVFFAAGSVLAFVAQLAGVISASWIILPGFVGAYAGASVLALAVGDYSRRSSYDAHRVRRSARAPKKRTPAAAPEASLGWTHHTISA